LLDEIGSNGKQDAAEHQEALIEAVTPKWSRGFGTWPALSLRLSTRSFDIGRCSGRRRNESVEKVSYRWGDLQARPPFTSEGPAIRQGRQLQPSKPTNPPAQAIVSFVPEAELPGLCKLHRLSWAIAAMAARNSLGGVLQDR
jgi:hypothetical protein